MVDLVLIKKNVVEVFGVDEIYGLICIVVYLNYSVYFILLWEKFVFDKEYLLGKCFGLLDYLSSWFGYIVFKMVM